MTNSETETAISPSEFSVKFQLYKPDGNFIIKDADTITSEYVEVELDEQTTASAGVGYADLKLTSNGVVIYTCHVSITIDTPVATDETIVSLSMIDGYIFPDDFQLKLTAGSNITISDDNVISATGGGGGGTGDYQDLINKPKINNVILSGNKTTAQLGLPTKTSDLTNDSGFITSAVNDLINYYKRSETYTKAEVNDLLASLSSLNLEVVAVLPDHDISTTTIYLVPKDVPGTDDVYDEYVYISNSWEKIGSTVADLSNYYTKAQADTLLSGKVDKVTGKGLSTNDFTNADVTKLNGIESGAEVNVQADWNQTNVDADDYIKNKPSIGVYTAGDGIDITNNRISVTNLVLNQISENTEHIGSPQTYDPTHAYLVGDICVYEGTWYKCNTGTSSGEAWDPDHWDATDAYGEIETLNQNLVKCKTLNVSIGCTYSDGGTIGYRSLSSERVKVTDISGYPTGATILAVIPYATGWNISCIAAYDGTYVACSAKNSGTYSVNVTIIYI